MCFGKHTKCVRTKGHLTPGGGKKLLNGEEWGRGPILYLDTKYRPNEKAHGDPEVPSQNISRGGHLEPEDTFPPTDKQRAGEGKCNRGSWKANEKGENIS